MTRPFDAQTTTDEVLEGVDLSGRRALVTGVSAGLGVETARALVAHGAHVLGTARDLDKARAATAHIAPSEAGGGRLELIEMDLASLASVRACATALLTGAQPLDLVVANAGVMACPKGVTADGFETQFGTNHLGHFVLINRIAPLLPAGARVVMLSSAGHRFADVDLSDCNFEHTPYLEFIAYGRSKTANVLFAVEFDRRHRSRGVRATAVHPGPIQTELGRYLTPGVIAQIAPISGAMVWKSIPQGAATTVWAGIVADAAAIGGRYCEDCHVAEEVSDPTVRAGVRAYALDPAHARALWSKSEELVRERFGAAPEPR